MCHLTFFFFFERHRGPGGNCVNITAARPKHVSLNYGTLIQLIQFIQKKKKKVRRKVKEAPEDLKAEKTSESRSKYD